MSELLPDDPDLIDRLKSGDHAAFTTVFHTWNHRLLRYVTVLVGPTDAPDVVAEAWLQVFRDLRKFEGDNRAFAGWVTTIARNRALDLLRRSARRSEVDIDTVAEPEAQDHTEDAALGNVGTASALNLMRHLPQDQAEAVMLRAVLGLDASLAGEILGKRPGAVRMAAHRGLKALERHLAVDPEAEV